MHQILHGETCLMKLLYLDEMIGKIENVCNKCHRSLVRTGRKALNVNKGTIIMTMK